MVMALVCKETYTMNILPKPRSGCQKKRANSAGEWYSQILFPSSFVAVFATGQLAWRWLPTFFQGLQWSAAWVGGPHSDCRCPGHQEGAGTTAEWRPPLYGAAWSHGRGTAIKKKTSFYVFVRLTFWKHEIITSTTISHCRDVLSFEK